MTITENTDNNHFRFFVGESKQRGVNFTNRMDENDTVATAQWTAPAGVTVAGSAISGDGKKASALFTPTASGQYQITCQVTTTSSGETLLESIYIRAEDI